MRRLTVLAPALSALALTLALPARADDTSVAIARAGTAYAKGNLKSASAALTLAITDIRARQNALLKAFLPPAPKGFTRTINPDFAQGFALTGGGAGIEAEYDSTNDTGSFRIDITVDNPIVDTMAPMLTNAQMMAAAGTIDKIGAQLVLQSDQSLATLVDKRILVQMQDDDVSVMLPVMKSMNFAALAKFDQK